jgi:hypothetical protein
VQGGTGATGGPGVQGTTGLQGIAGSNGSQGTAGTNGTQGTTGGTGGVGNQGTTGAKGDPGNQGTAGSNGSSIQGATGSTGPQGTTGSGISLSNGANTRILVAQSTTAVAADSNLTYNGSTLAVGGSITATGNITAYYTSDKRQKNNIHLIIDALEKVKKLNGVNWDWNETNTDEVTQSLPTTGLIAQEVLEVLPEVVKQREDGYLALDYSKMLGLIVEAIKELDAKLK